MVPVFATRTYMLYLSGSKVWILSHAMRRHHKVWPLFEATRILARSEIAWKIDTATGLRLCASPFAIHTELGGEMGTSQWLVIRLVYGRKIWILNHPIWDESPAANSGWFVNMDLPLNKTSVIRMNPFGTVCISWSHGKAFHLLHPRECLAQEHKGVWAFRFRGMVAWNC